MTTSPSPSTIAARRRAFRELHASGCFVIPNPWDAGSARYLASLGFKALASTSSGDFGRRRFARLARRHLGGRRFIPGQPPSAIHDGNANDGKAAPQQRPAQRPTDHAAAPTKPSSEGAVEALSLHQR